MKHVKDAYLNAHNGFTYTIFEEYTEWISKYQEASNEWAELSNEEKMDFNNIDIEMQTIMARIAQYLDYFGNPIGWVPMLSFEVNKIAFEQEIDKAIRVMYLSYWLKSISRSDSDRQNAIQDAITMVKNELGDNTTALTALAKLIPDLQKEANILQGEIDSLIDRIDQKMTQLLAQAEKNVEKQNRLNKASGILKAIATIAPVIPVVGTAISVGASIGYTALSVATGASDTYGYGNAAEGFLKSASAVSGYTNISATLGQIKLTHPDSVKSAYDSISGQVTNLMSSVNKLRDVFNKSSAPSDQIQAELNKLTSNNPEFKELVANSEVLNSKKEVLMQKLSTALDNFVTATIESQNNISAIDVLNGNLFDGNSRNDLRAMQYLDAMERRSKERLLKYHYYIAKSYEYRLLKSYNTDLDLNKMFERFKAIADTSGSKMLSTADFQNLKAIYEEQLSSLTENILTEYNSNRPELSVPLRFKLKEEDLATLNEGRGINLNIFERGMIPSNHENVRIVSFKVVDIDVQLDGGIGSYAYFDLVLEHSGISRLINNGEIYYFNHINNQNQNPITWGVRWDAINDMVNPFEPSFASSSLLYSILNGLNETSNIMIYSRPAAWADIRISKDNMTSAPNTKMIIKDLTFELQYDFMLRPSNSRILDIYAKDVRGSDVPLSPYITLSQEDKTGRTNGRPTMHRTYIAGEKVTVEAPQEYGRWEFANWTGRSGAIISEQTKITITMTNDSVLNANYRYTGPAIFATADTIWISNESIDTNIVVTFQSDDSEDIVWNAQSNNPSWITVTSTAKGTNDGGFSINISENSAQTNRIGTITIIPEDDWIEPYVVVVIQGNQTSIPDVKNDFGSDMKIYPNPFTGAVRFTGAEGCTLQISNATGAVVHTQKITNSDETLQLAHLSAGIYFFRIEKDGNSKTVKMVKN